MNVFGKKVLVLGLARSGYAVARLLHHQGAIVTVNDQKERAAHGSAVDELEALDIKVVVGEHPEDIVTTDTDWVVKNPGIPYSSAPVVKALSLGIPVLTEVEIAYWNSQAPIIGITGSNGKTTTTTLVGEIMTEAGLQPVVAGNIGLALTEVVQDVRAEQWIVAELSSFQLMGTQTFRPKIGALLNLYKAHLDYHGTFDEYAKAKSSLFANQHQDDIAVLNADQQEVWQLHNQCKAQVFPFSLTQGLEEGVFVKDENICIRQNGQTTMVCPVSDVLLKGAFNLENILAATAITWMAGADAVSIRDVLTRFRGVEHRLEFVASKNGVEYFNDSKATNAEAATRAITSFTQPVILIAGGLDRGTDFAELIPIFKKHVKAIVVLGHSAEKMLSAAEKAGVSVRIQATGIEEAVHQATEVAAYGDTILLSPACASWDMYRSFEERGRIFKDTVHTM